MSVIARSSITVAMTAMDKKKVVNGNCRNINYTHHRVQPAFSDRPLTDELYIKLVQFLLEQAQPFRDLPLVNGDIFPNQVRGAVRAFKRAAQDMQPLAMPPYLLDQFHPAMLS
jgi:hypothetical protein